MKKLLTTVLGVICILLPTVESVAQKRVETMRFAGWQTENPNFTFSRQLKAAYDGMDTRNNWGSYLTMEYVDNAPQHYPAAASALWTSPESSLSYRTPFAQGQLNSGNINVELDYSGCLAGTNSTTYAEGYNASRLWYYTSRLVPSEGVINLYPGVQFKVSASGKRMKRVILHTGLPAVPDGNYLCFNSIKFASNLALINDFKKLPRDFDKNMTMKMVTANDGTVDVVINIDDLWGTDGGVCIKVNGFGGMERKSVGGMVYPQSLGRTPSAEYTSNANSCRQNELAFRMKSIEVEYFDEIEHSMPLTQSVAENGLSYFNSVAGKWSSAPKDAVCLINKSGAKTEKVGIGDYIIEIDASNAVGDKAYALRGDASYGVGIMLGSRFRIYPDPAKYKAMDGNPAKAISVKAKLSGYGGRIQFSTGSVQYTASGISTINAARSDLFVSPQFQGDVTGSNLAQNKDYIFIANSEVGMREDIDSWLSTIVRDDAQLYNPSIRESYKETTITQDIVNGKGPLMWIDEIDGLVTSSAVMPSVSGTLQVASLQRGRMIDNVWSYVGESQLQVVVPKDNNYPYHTVRYILSDRVLPPSEFDITKSTLAGDGFTIAVKDFKGVVNARVYGLLNGQEIPADEVMSMTVEPLDFLPLTSYADLLKSENVGKLIGIDFSTNYFYGQKRFATGNINYNQTTDFAVDADGNVVKLSIKYPKGTSEGVGCLFSYRNYVPVGGLLGVLKLDGLGLPVVEISDYDTFDYRDYCAKGYDGSMSDVPASQYAFETGQSKTFNADNIRHIVTLRQFTVADAVNNVLKDSDGNCVVLTGSTSYLPAGGLLAGKKYTVKGLLDYDEASSNYTVFLTTSVYESVNVPDVNIPEGELDATQDIEGVDKVYCVTLLSGKFNMEFLPVKSPYNIYYHIEDVFGEKSVGVPFLRSPNNESVITQQFNRSALTFKNGIARICIRVANQGNQQLSSVIEYSDPIVIELQDYMDMGLKVGSAKDFLEEYSDKTMADVDDNTYVTITGGDSGATPLAVAIVKKNYILAVDLSSSNPDYMFLKCDFDDGWMEKSDEKTSTGIAYNYKFHVYFRSINNWLGSYYRELQAGDAIRTIVGRPQLDRNNWLLNLTCAPNQLAASAQQGGSPIYKDEVESLLLKGTAIQPDHAFTEKDLNKLVSIKGVTVAKNGYVANTSTPLSLKWDILIPEKKSFHQSIINNVSVNEPFNLTGVVLSDGNGGYGLELLDLTLDYKVEARLCAHEGHATYSGDFTGLDGLEGGSPVLLTGVQLFKNGDTYTTYIGGKNYNLSYLTPEIKDAAESVIAEGPTDEFVLAAIKLDDENQFDADSRDELKVIVIERIAPLLDYNNRPVKLEPVASEGMSSSFIDYTHLSFSNASGRTIYYKVLPAPNPTKQPTKDDWSSVEESVFNYETTPYFDSSMWISAYTCDPGMETIEPATCALLRKSSITVKSIEELVNYKPAAGTYYPSYQFAGEALVAEVNHANDYAVLTDGEGRHIMVSYMTNSEEHISDDIKVGSYVSDFVISPVSPGTHYAYRINTDAIGKFRAVDEHASEINPSAAKRHEIDVTAEHYGQYIRLMNAKVEEDAFGNKTVTFPYSNTQLRLCHFGESFDYTGDGLYHLTGYVLPQTEVGLRKSSDAPQAAMFAARAVQPLDFFVTDALFKEKSLPPVYEVENAESFEDGKVITIWQVTVSISCEAKDAKLEVSVDNGPWNVYYGPFVVPCSAIIHARATEPDKEPTEADLEVVMEYLSGSVRLTTVPAAGYTLVMATPGDESLDPEEYEIRYTIDGSEPGRASELYNGAVRIEKPTTFKAVLIENGKRPGDIASVNVYVRSGSVQIVDEPQAGYTTVTLAPAVEDYSGNIYYTTDGSEPTTASKLYTAPFTLTTDGTTVKAFMVEDSKDQGDVSSSIVGVRSSDVTMTVDERPSYSLVTLALAGSYNGTIRYTLDGTEPTASSAVYGAPLNVTRSGTVVKARLFEDGKTEGDVLTGTVNVRSGNVTITTNADEGITYVTMTVSGNSGGAVIRFTLDGSDPTEESAIYTETIELFETAVLKAAVFEEGKGRGEIHEVKVEVTGTIPLPLSGDLTYTLDIKADEQAAYVTLAPKTTPEGTYYIYFSRNGATPSVATERYHDDENEVVKVTRSCTFKAVMIERGKRPGKVLEFDIVIPQSTTNPEKPDDSSGIDGVDADSEAGVSVEGSMINAPEGSEIFDLMGRKMRSGVELRPGVYIVRTRAGVVVKVRVG